MSAIALAVECVNDDPAAVRACVESWLGTQSGENSIGYTIWCKPEHTRIIEELSDLAGNDGHVLAAENRPMVWPSPLYNVTVGVNRPARGWDSTLAAFDGIVFSRERHGPRGDVRFSILVPSMPHRNQMRMELVRKIEEQHSAMPPIEIVSCISCGEATIGYVRQFALECAIGDYVAFVDDDDMIDDRYLAEIMPLLDGQNDGVGFLQRADWKRREYGTWRCSAEYAEWYEGEQLEPGGPRRGGHRPPFHVTPMKREIALAAGFPLDSSYGEDAEFSRRVVASGMVRRMPVIEQIMYIYNMPMIRGIPPRRNP